MTGSIEDNDGDDGIGGERGLVNHDGGHVSESPPEHWWSVDVKRGDRVERTGADCREPEKRRVQNKRTN